MIGDKGTYDDWGLLLKAGWSLEAPSVKTKYVNIPGADGSRDLTESLAGEPKYNDRKLTLTLIFPPAPTEEWENCRREIATYCHGQKMHITLPDDRDRHLTGRLDIGSLVYSRAQAELKVTAVCDPYLYDNRETVIAVTANNPGRNITLDNARKRVTPWFTITGSAATLKLRETTYSLAIGADQRLSGFLLYPGDNIINIASVGSNATTVTMVYRQGAL